MLRGGKQEILTFVADLKLFAFNANSLDKIGYTN